MKKFLSLLLFCLTATSVWGEHVITFIPGEDCGINPTVVGGDQISKDGVTISSTSAAFNADQYRFGKGSVTTFTSEVGNMTRIEFYCTASGGNKYGPGGFAVQEGYYCDDILGIWIGNSPWVQFIAEFFQVRASKIVVTVDDSALAAPTITPASGTFYTPIEVSITCRTGGAKIYYTTNGANPTTSSTQYTVPFTLSTGTTVKAISFKEGETSEVVTATYEFASATPVEDIAAFQNADEDAVVIFRNPVTVLAQNRHYLYVKDHSGYASFFGDCGQTYVNGDVIPAGFTGTKTDYACEPELIALSGFQPACDNNPIGPEEITADEVGHSTFAHFVMIRDAIITQEGDRNYTLTDPEGNTCPVYFGTMGASAPNNLPVIGDIVGIVGSYKPRNGDCIYQLLPVSISIPIPDWTLCSLEDLPDGTEFYCDHEVTVLAQMGTYLFLKDGEDCYGLAYGVIPQTYDTGDIIPPGWHGTKSTWNSYPELKNPADFQPASRRETVVPEECTFERFGHATWGHYVVFRQVIIDYEKRVLIDQHGNEIPFYIRGSYWNPPTDLSKRYDVTGIVSSYGSGSQLIYQLLLMNYLHDEPIHVGCIDDLRNLPNGTTVRFTTPLTAIFQQGNNLYVADSCAVKTLMYGDIQLSLTNGDLIKGDAKITSYRGIIELSPVGEWVKVGVTEPVKPESIPIEELTQDMVHKYLFFGNVQILIGEDGKTYIYDGTERLLLFDKFQVEVEFGPLVGYPCGDVNMDYEINIADINLIVEAIINGVPSWYSSDWWPEDFMPYSNYDVWGFLYVYNNTLELIPIRIRNNGGGMVYPPIHYLDVNGDGEVNISDVSVIVNCILY